MKINENGWKWMKTDENSWKMNISTWKMDEKWIKMDENGWKFKLLSKTTGWFKLIFNGFSALR